MIDEPLTKREKAVIYMAARKCGLSYRAACNRDIRDARRMKERGYVYLQETNRALGKYIFRATDKGIEAIR